MAVEARKEGKEAEVAAAAEAETAVRKMEEGKRMKRSPPKSRLLTPSIELKRSRS